MVRATEFITRKTSPLEPTNRFWKIGETQWAGAGSVLVPDMTANPSGTRFVEVIDAKEGYTIALVQVDEGDADQEADLQRIVAAGVCRACAPGPLVDELRKSLSHVTDYLDEYVSAVHLHETHEGAKRDIQAARILLASTGGTSPTSGPEEITEAGQGVLLQIYSWLWQHDSDGCGCDGEEVRAGEWGTNKEIGGADTVEFLSNILPFQGPPKTPVPGPWNSAEESTRLARQVATAAVIRGACPTDDEMRQEIEIAADKYREAVRDWFANNDASELYVPDDARVYPADDGQGATVLVPIYIDAGDLPA